jgi:hypothetical protein
MIYLPIGSKDHSRRPGNHGMFRKRPTPPWVSFDLDASPELDLRLSMVMLEFTPCYCTYHYSLDKAMAEMNTEDINHEAISVDILPGTNSETLDPARMILPSSTQSSHSKSSTSSHCRKIQEIINRIHQEKVCLRQGNELMVDTLYRNLQTRRTRP